MKSVEKINAYYRDFFLWNEKENEYIHLAI